MSQTEVRVFTPIKRVPTMIGKAPNGQRLPFGPYTMPQIVVAVFGIVVVSICAEALPANPAVVFGSGLAVTAIAVYLTSMIPYSGVRILSRLFWYIRLALVRRPVSASGMPIATDSTRMTLFIEESTVVVLPAELVHAGGGRR
ncbi:hypothetical protein D5S18_00920 [Nocardia panacis]|uniref:Uncharacterized protein n=1 Tax=Nocardia panacis TaxID=2340916 RepID=A0A3A4KCS2_9NOCA|nr:hypothetical protein [Nocardia panacis]RJO79868.1 hypothetical protein D5S18_00920 [Nocardia panacis]